MPDRLATPKKIVGPDGEAPTNTDVRSRREDRDRDIRLLTLIGLLLLLAALACYKLASLIASTCWACG